MKEKDKHKDLVDVLIRQFFQTEEELEIALALAAMVFRSKKRGGKGE